VDLGLTNKTALVLGAGGGLGGAIAHSLAQEGANVAIVDVAKDNLSSTAAAIASKGGNSLPLVWDLAD
jgi:3-oxoacyl-[acyl-carrier protein] reductase